ncbi:hypothetical protein G6L37_34965 [Agrobacterium rubi]|nr:hypothetical protein [Agrobacterium rubi]NTF23771.1 hypothetical protein [Agrobacterium rubi]
MLVELKLYGDPGVLPESRRVEMGSIPRVGEYVGSMNDLGKVTNVLYFVPTLLSPKSGFWSRLRRKESLPEPKVIISLELIPVY